MCVAEETIEVSSTPLGDPTTGHWCPQCLLPSALQVTLAVEMRVQGATTQLCSWLTPLTFCPDCEWQDAERYTDEDSGVELDFSAEGTDDADPPGT